METPVKCVICNTTKNCTENGDSSDLYSLIGLYALWHNAYSGFVSGFSFIPLTIRNACYPNGECCYSCMLSFLFDEYPIIAHTEFSSVPPIPLQC